MGKQTTAVDLRWLIRRDMPEVVEIEQCSFPEPYSEDELAAFMRQRNCIGMVAESSRGDVIHGYMIYELHKEHLEILTLAVAPESRGTGIGTALIDRLKGKCSIQHRQQLRLVVSEQNLSAQLWMQRQGFMAEDYYRHKFGPHHDGILFVWRVG